MIKSNRKFVEGQKWLGHISVMTNQGVGGKVVNQSENHTSFSKQGTVLPETVLSGRMGFVREVGKIKHDRMMEQGFRRRKHGTNKRKYYRLLSIRKLYMINKHKYNYYR